MALIEDQKLPTTLEDVNMAVFTNPATTTTFEVPPQLPSGGITPYSEYSKALPPGLPGEFFIGGEKVMAPAPFPTPSVSVAPAAVPAAAPAFDVSAFLESLIPSVDPDAFSSALTKQLTTLGKTEEDLGAELIMQEKLGEMALQDELAIQKASLEASYAPRFEELQRGLERAQQSAAFGGAAAGSVRGSRAVQKQVDLSQQASKVEQALAAEQGIQLRLIEAQLRGEPNAVLNGLRDQMSSLKALRQQTQVQLQLAEEELLGIQAAIAADVQEQQLQLLLDSLDAQGLTIDPFSGETVTTLEGEKIKSSSALADAKTAEIYMQLQQPDLDIEYFSDEIGNTYANIFDAKTGTLETIDLGRLNSAQKWAIEALNAPVVSGYGGATGGATPQFDAATAAASLLQQGVSVAEYASGGLQTEFKNQGLNDEQLNLLTQEMYLQSYETPPLSYKMEQAIKTALPSLATPAGIAGILGAGAAAPSILGTAAAAAASKLLPS